ncbi:hypothetical protein AB0D57_24910 [Streptomyces sp. NPDC048275]|uniref:hypothetical protein n=1 Tax=Streptomyces sp. NPDC048275 TaxID=3155629 RepID=UPI0033EE181A
MKPPPGRLTVSTPPPTTQPHEPSTLRSRLADQLLAAGHIHTAAARFERGHLVERHEAPAA